MKDEGLLNAESALRKEENLENILTGFSNLLVAFSGGVDSNYLLSRAVKMLGSEQVMAVTIVSLLNPPGEKEEAKALAEELNVKLLFIEIDPLVDPEFRKNSPERCYLCKIRLYRQLLDLADTNDIEAVIDGSNADDPADYRPGMRALKELGIRSPLLEASLTKDEIRFLSKKAGLQTWDKPSAACLASRFTYGEELTVQKLRQVSEAERFLHDSGFNKNLRVRYHDCLARIEVDADDFKNLLQKREVIIKKLEELGFLYVTLDLRGFESGSMNRLI